MRDFWEVFIKLPWHKIAAPILPVLLVDVYVGTYLMNLHTLNIANNLLDRVPNDKTFSTFLWANIFIIFAYLGLNAFHNITDRKSVV